MPSSPDIGASAALTARGGTRRSTGFRRPDAGKDAESRHQAAAVAFASPVDPGCDAPTPMTHVAANTGAPDAPRAAARRPLDQTRRTRIERGRIR